MKRILCLWVPRRSGPPAPEKRVTVHSPLERFSQILLQFSPTVGAAEVDDADCLFLDITGLEHLWGSETRLAQRLLRRLAELGFNAHAAVADTVGAAWAVAEGKGKAEGEKGKDSGWPATGVRIPHSAFRIPNSTSSAFPLPPSALRIVPPGETLAALCPLPLETLRLPAPTLELLHQLGLWRIGQVARLPRQELPARFGPELLRRWDQALGLMDEPLPACRPSPKFQAGDCLEYPTTRREAIGPILQRLLDQLAERLREHGLGALRLECRLTCLTGGEAAFSVGFFEPSDSPRHLASLAAMQLEQAAIPAPVTGVHVEIPATAPVERRQQDLFADVPPQRHPRHLAALVDRLSNRLGREAVLRPRLVPDAQPELACTYDPLVAGAIARRRPSRQRALPARLPPRPLRLLVRPVPVSAVAIRPDGPPSAFHLHGQQHQVAHTWGPERIETGWWRGRAVGRDYFRVETSSGARFWLFRRLSDAHWFLHGMFE